jgi:hypothetical protein
MIGKDIRKMTLPVNTIYILKQKVVSNCQNKDKTGKPKFNSGNQGGPVER